MPQAWNAEFKLEKLSHALYRYSPACHHIRNLCIITSPAREPSCPQKMYHHIPPASQHIPKHRNIKSPTLCATDQINAINSLLNTIL
jgi:hypothetical protein